MAASSTITGIESVIRGTAASWQRAGQVHSSRWSVKHISLDCHFSYAFIAGHLGSRKARFLGVGHAILAEARCKNM